MNGRTDSSGSGRQGKLLLSSHGQDVTGALPTALRGWLHSGYPSWLPVVVHSAAGGSRSLAFCCYPIITIILG